MRPIRVPLAVLLVAGLAAPALAQGPAFTIPLPKGAKPEQMKVAYDCTGGLKVQAEYFNAPPLALATISFKGQFAVLANVLAGSGARYAGGSWVWWTKGDKADLYDLTKGEDAPAVASCSSVP